MNATVRLLLDFGPLAAFFSAYKFSGLMHATMALILCTTLSLLIVYLVERKVAIMPLVSGIAVAIFGGLTLWLNDELFIKIKPTLVNLLFASILFGGLYFKKPLLKYLFESAFQMNQEGWRILTLRWAFFFVALAGLNEVIWRNFPTDFWVSFKVFGMFTLTIIFTLTQLPLIKKHLLPPGEDPI